MWTFSWRKHSLSNATEGNQDSTVIKISQWYSADSVSVTRKGSLESLIYRDAKRSIGLGAGNGYFSVDD